MEKCRKWLTKAATVISIILIASALASCGGTTRKKKYRFGGCEVATAVKTAQNIATARHMSATIW